MQHGDYAEAVHRFARGGAEDYYAQRYTVDALAEIAARPDVAHVEVLCLSRDRALERLPSGVFARGIAVGNKRGRWAEVKEAVAAVNPTHLVVADPTHQLVQWAIGNRVHVLPILADSFRDRRLRARLRHLRLAAWLSHPSVPVVANHGLASALDLVDLGVSAKKVLAFDWPALIAPSDYPARPPIPGGRPIRLLFVGALLDNKGLGDAIRSLRCLDDRGVEATLTVVGRGSFDRYAALAEELRVAARIEFLGSQPHARVLEHMRRSDIVLVPSHGSYPEGLPMTLYEAFCTRTPVIAADHPMFRFRVHHEENALVVPERSPAAIANAVVRLKQDELLYVRLSVQAALTAADYLCPLEWRQLLLAFLEPGGLDRVKPLDHGHEESEPPRPPTGRVVA